MKRSRTLMGAAICATLAFSCVALAQNAPSEKPAPSDEKAVEVMEAAMKAVGGRKALEEIETIAVTAEMAQGDGPQAMKIAFDIKWGAQQDGDDEERAAVDMTITQMNMTIQMGCDGTTAWSSDPLSGAKKVLKGVEKQQIEGLVGMGRMNLALRFAEEESERMAYLGTETFGDQECHKIQLFPKDEEDKANGATQFLFIDTKTNLLAGLEAQERTQHSIVKMSDYKDVGGFKFFHTVTMQQGRQNMSLTFDKIETNKVADGAFELPDDVKAMVNTDGGASQPNG